MDVVPPAAGVGDARGGNVDERGGGRIKERSRKCCVMRQQERY
jgi:hypothetical protein